jgi:Ca2+-binding EF-hand superfamily protein
LICLEKIKKFGEKIDIDEQVYNEIYRTASSTLKQYKFYTLSQKNALVQTASSEEELQTILTTFDKTNQSTINKVLTIFQIMSEMNIVQANKQFESFLKNLDWDCGFIMKVASMDFSKLDDASYTTKKSIIREIESILTNYQSLPDNKKNIETY